MKVVRMNLSDLHRPERNVRMHTDKQLKEFRRSVEMFGQIRPIVADEGGTILAGNGLYEALLSMGRTEADCYIISGMTGAQKKKLMLADNRVFDLGVDDLAALDAFVLELKDDLDIPGFEEDLLRSLMMDAEQTTAAMQDYGTIDEGRVDTIRETHERYEAQDAAAAQRAEEYIPIPQAQQTGSTEQPRKFILCPKCGERIWL